MDSSLPGSSVNGISQARIPQQVGISIPDPGLEPASPTLAGGFFTIEPLGEPILPWCLYKRTQSCTILILAQGCLFGSSLLELYNSK